jgi:hypothetical protein
VKIMPGGDRTGPMGMGPMTGRRAGYCAGFSLPGYANPMGFGMSFGRGRGFRRMAYFRGMPTGFYYGHPAYVGRAYAQPEFDEKEFLANEAKFLEEQLQQVKKRLKLLDESNKE